MKNFEDKVAVITGAGSGIGRALALNLARRGCHVALADINKKTLEETANEVRKQKVKVHAHVLDVSDKEKFLQYPEKVIAALGKVNIVINNAGIGTAGKVEELAIEDYEKSMGIHFWGVVYGTKFFLPHIRKAGVGHIVNVSSVAGLLGFPGMSAYCAAKFAIRGFTESLRGELKGSNIGVSCVHPGGVATNIARDSDIVGDDPFDGTLDVPNDRNEIHEHFQKMAMTSAEEAATIIIDGITNKRERILVGPDATAFDLVQRFLPEDYGNLTGLLKYLIPARK